MDDNDTIRAAIAEANRTLEQHSTGHGHYVVTRMDVVWMAYDEEIDDIIMDGSRRRTIDTSADYLTARPRSDA